MLTEVLNWFSRSGPYWRGKAATLVHDLRSDPDVDVLPQTRADFDAALALVRGPARQGVQPDRLPVDARLKGLGVTEVLTNDHHFTQEGFTILFPTP